MPARRIQRLEPFSPDKQTRTHEAHMTRSTSLRTLLFVPLACAALYGCPSGAGETTTDLGAYADVLIEGTATDEGLVALGQALDEGAPAEDPAQAPFLDEPAAGELPGSPIPTFKWSFGGPSAGLRASPVRVLTAAGVRWPAPSSPGGAGLLPAGPLLQLFGPPRAAHAHGDLNGPATFLVFSTPADPKLVRVFTDATSYTPSQETWDKLATASGEITLTLIGAVFENNRIADGGGPFQGSTTKLTVAK